MARALGLYQRRRLNDIEAAIARSDAEANPETQAIRRFLAAQRAVPHS